MWEEGFIEIHAPTISLSTDVGKPFNVTFHGKEMLLSTSYQLYKQASLRVFDKVYILQPAFRNERVRTPLHLSEFWILDIEMAEATCHEVMGISERLIVRVCEDAILNCKDELEYLNRKLNVPKTPFSKFTHSEIVNRINNLFGRQLTTSDKITWQTMVKLSKKFKEPFWITDWSTKLVKEWYYLQDPNNPKITRFFELYYPEGFEEAISGGEREYRVPEMIRKLTEMNLNCKKYQWYIELFKKGMPRHAGCGLGVDRLVRWICGIKDVAETTLFPRTISDHIP